MFDATFLASDSRPNAVRRERYQVMQRMALWKEAGTLGAAMVLSVCWSAVRAGTVAFDGQALRPHRLE